MTKYKKIIFNNQLSYLSLLFIMIVVLELYFKIESILFIVYILMSVLVLAFTRKKLKINNQIVSISIYMIYSFLSMLWSPNLSISFQKITVLFAVVAVFVLQLQESYSAKQIRLLEKILFFHGVIILMYLLVNGTFIDRRLSLIGLNSAADANTLSVWLLLPTFYGLKLAFSTKKRFLPMYLLSLSGFGYIIILTASRAGFAGFILVIISYILTSNYNYKKLSNFFIWVFVAFISLLLISLTPDFFIQRVFESGWESFGGRAPIWESMINVIKTNPNGIVFGYGYNSSTFYTYQSFVPHNLLFGILFEEGIIGTLLYLIFLLSLIANALRYKRYEMLGLLFAFLVISLTLQMDTYRPLWIVYFLTGISIKSVN